MLHVVVTDGRPDIGPGPAPDKPDLVITPEPADDELPSCRALFQAAKCGLVELSGRRKLLVTFLRLFAPRQPA